MPGIQDPAHGSGASFPIGGPGGPDAAAPVKAPPKQPATPKQGFLGNRAVSSPPQGSAKELHQKAHPIAADQMPKQPKLEAGAAKQPANVNVLSGQAPASEAGSSKKAVSGVFNQLQPALSQLGADMQKALSPNGQAPLTEPKVVNGNHPSAPPLEQADAQMAGDEISPAERAAVYEQADREVRNAEQSIDEQPGAPGGVAPSAPDLADLQPGAPAAAGDGDAPNEAAADDLLGAFALLAGDKSILDNATEEGATPLLTPGEQAEAQNPGEAAAPAAVPQGPASGNRELEAFRAASIKGFEVSSVKEFIREIYNAQSPLLFADLFNMLAPARPVDHDTQVNRAALRQQIHIFPDQQRLHVFQALNQAQHHELQQQYPGVATTISGLSCYRSSRRTS